MDRLLETTAHDILATDDPWPALIEAGLTGVGIPEEAGGSGGTFAEAAMLLRIAAHHAASVPLAETILAGRTLAGAGLPVPEGVLTVASGELEVVQGGGGPRLTGTLARVPWARSAHRLVVLTGGMVAIIDPVHAEITEGANVAGEPRDDVRLSAAPCEAATDRGAVAHSGAVAGVVTEGEAAEGADDLMMRGALARAVQLTAAMERALDLTVDYAGRREQFGRPIGRFQAVQQRLAELAGEVAVADVAVRAAVRAPDDLVAVAAAKANASRAAGRVAAIAHQVHGAMGVTQEYPLHRRTRRLWAWREEYGSESYWASVLGDMGDDPWFLLTGTTTVTTE
ncbi:acyl-CoA/acyl-ACP dehydrogenase [Actinomadura barringtoniae]|uniref:Acyl-CoA/acyl-ACP dehydrogenase n=1 Tax=Actinomadura barringtoniae TaxID=1427535 RepID=A0A939TA54_9ACTN|nr:acyl-CoA dehydrogenase family protein [Actinomadura barringtoniae]MBO2455783.1 acyl-CoA/acyl-ACP dehydrogenase [Actinomadura barringtoniae]